MTVTSCASATFSTFPTISDQVYYVGDTASALTITAPTMSDSSCDNSLSYTMKLSSGVTITTPPFSFVDSTRILTISTTDPALTGTSTLRFTGTISASNYDDDDFTV